jgi:hypothetical protein
MLGRRDNAIVPNIPSSTVRPNIAVLVRVRYRATLPPSLAGKGARELGLGVPHLSENRYNPYFVSLGAKHFCHKGDMRWGSFIYSVF